MSDWYQLFVYIPASHLVIVKQALFDAGAGRYANYDCCAWQTLGEGQFRALSGSQPFIGKEGEIERVPEYRVEMICSEQNLSNVIKALKQNHPYEEPTFGLVKLCTIPF